MTDERDWRPLSTAPHDGVDVELLLEDGETAVGWWHDYRAIWRQAETDMPLGIEGEDVLAWRPKEAAF